MRWNRRSSGIRAEGDNSSALSCTNDEFLHNIPIVMHTKNRHNQEVSMFRELKSYNCKYER